MTEYILPSEIENHPNKDYTWEMDDYEIEEKIKELRKQIYHLQQCRKKQPHLILFRKRNFSKNDDLVCDIFYGWSNKKEDLYVADYWRPVTREQADLFMKKYDFKPEAIEIFNRTIEQSKKHD